MSILDDLIDLFSIEQINRNLNETEDYITQKAAEVDSAIKTVSSKSENKKRHIDVEWVARTALKQIKIKLRKL